MCGGENSGSEARINFVHQGMFFTAFKAQGECGSCAYKAVRDSYDEFGELFRRSTVGVGFAVDWSRYCQERNEAILRRHWDLIKRVQRINSVLLALGVFSLQPCGNFMVCEKDGRYVNPRFDATHILFFTDKNDAEEFVYGMLQKALDLLNIFRIGDAFQAVKV